MSIRTILFDLDGTLIDTNELIIESFIHTFNQYGYHFTREEMIDFNGPPLKDTFEKIAPGKSEAMIHTYREHNFLHHEEFVKPFPYVIEVLERLQAAGFDLGIVTTKMRKGVDLGLEVTDLSRFFETIVTLDDVTCPKPDPEPVLKAMYDLEGEHASTLMIGDNSHDIEAGQRAHVQTAGVAWTGKGEAFLRTYQPTYMLQDMRDLLTVAGIKA
ncbi:Inorganic diphosphatase [Lentibacillus sp. JNUCC-1]|uniref:pyrophosphatase PpaX n=1 Tax=Lentibacillus sp. JNUCC-1 TaxID=2654513 RepID=UPI0012E7ED51|nr:pyrophosphatase PpaX [Lentibacillus sp. JNUCC-1]MUV39087.1 Inorganic diphosphatase [Lentibacillus sp. JNUCC-1]